MLCDQVRDTEKNVRATRCSVFTFMKNIVKCTSVNARVKCAVTENRVHQGSSSCTPPAHKSLFSTCAFCAFVEVFSPCKFNKISGFRYSGIFSLSWFLDFPLSVSIVETSCATTSSFPVLPCVPLHRSVKIH